MKTRKFKKRYIVLCLAILLICRLVGCGISDSSEDNTWPEHGLGSMLPEPDAKKVHIGYDYDDSFSADIKNAKEEDFTSYVAKCKEIGFTVDADSDSDEYSAFNSDGYKLSISFYNSLESVSIMLNTPKANGTFSWPTIGLATLLPTPGTNVGTINIDSSTQFNAYIGETSFDDYKAYVQQCIENGFDVAYNNSEKVFSADNKDGVSLRLEYEGFNTMYISMYAPDDIEAKSDEVENKVDNSEAVETDNVVESEETVSEEIEKVESEENEKTESENNSSSVDGMRPEFKEAMDSYETFMNEYCDFMKKYAESPSDLSLIAEYADYISKYAEAMEKLDAIDEGELSAAELKYYLEVTGRITQKLADVATQ